MITPISILDKIANDMMKCRFEFIVYNYPHLVLEVTISAMKFYKHAKRIEAEGVINKKIDSIVEYGNKNKWTIDFTEQVKTCEYILKKAKLD